MSIYKLSSTEVVPVTLFRIPSFNTVQPKSTHDSVFSRENTSAARTQINKVKYEWTCTMVTIKMITSQNPAAI